MCEYPLQNGRIIQELISSLYVFHTSWVFGDVHKFPSQKERRVRIFGYPKCTFFTVWTSTCTPNQCWVGTKSSPSVFHLLEPFIALARPGHRPEYERWCAIALKLHLSLLDGPSSALQEMGQAAQIGKMGAPGNYGGISKFPWFRRQCQGNAIIREQIARPWQRKKKCVL